MGERIKLLRSKLGLSGERFGESLGVGRTAISLIESGKNNVTDQVVKLICLTYSVSEQWLRTGEGEMFKPTNSVTFEYSDPLEQAIMQTYFSLDKETRKKAMDNIKKLLAEKHESDN